MLTVYIFNWKNSIANLLLMTSMGHPWFLPFTRFKSRPDLEQSADSAYYQCENNFLWEAKGKPQLAQGFAEILGLKLCQLFGVKIPDVIGLVPFNMISESSNKNNAIVVMSQVVGKKIPEDFVTQYLSQGREKNKAFHFVDPETNAQIRTVGFGAVVAVAYYLHDIGFLNPKNLAWRIKFDAHGSAVGEIVQIHGESSSGFLWKTQRNFHCESFQEMQFIVSDLLPDDRLEFYHTAQSILSTPHESETYLIQLAISGHSFDFAPNTTERLLRRRERLAAAFRPLLGSKQFIIPAISSHSHSMLPNSERNGSDKFTLARDCDSTNDAFVFLLPQAPESFVGRETELQQILESLKTQSPLVITQNSPTMFAIGKSQLAQIFAHRMKHYYASIIWLNAQAALETQLRELVQSQLGHSGEHPTPIPVTELMKVAYEKLAHPSLIIFDNAVSKDSLEEFFPSTEQQSEIHVLICSKFKFHWTNFNTIELGGFSLSDARQFLLSQFETFPEALDSLIEITQSLPLPLAQASAYIKHQHLPIQEFPQHFFLHQLRACGWEETPQDLLKTTSTLNLVTLQRVNPQALKLLQSCIGLAAELIPWQILSDLCNLGLEELWPVIQLLEEFALARWDSQFQALSLNQQVVETLDELWETPEARVAHFTQLIEHLSKRLQYDKSDSNQRELAQRLSLHVEVFLELPVMSPELEVPLACLAYHNACHLLYTAQCFASSLIGFQRAITVLTRKFGTDHSDIALALMNLGLAHGELGNYAAQKTALEQTLQIQEKSIGAEHIDTACTLLSLGTVNANLGNFLEQKSYLERALQIIERTFGPDHFHVGFTLNNLGNAYGSLGNYKEQKLVLERALQIQEAHFGADHPNVGLMLGNLGTVHGELGNHAEQRQLLERAVSILENKLGPSHPEVGRALMNLGNAFGALGKYHDQQTTLERALRIESGHFGIDHPKVAMTMVNLATSHGLLGNYLQQKDMLENALKIFESHFGSNHPDVAMTLTNLGITHGSLGNHVEKQYLLERALKIYESLFGPNHPEIAIALGNLANAAGSQGNYQLQLSLLDRALKMQELHLGSDHPHIANCLRFLAIANGSLNNHHEKVSLLERALLIQQLHYHSRHPEVLVTMLLLGNAHFTLGHLEQQQRVLLQALQHIAESVESPETHKVSQEQLKNSAHLIAHSAVLGKAVSILECFLGPNHPEIAITRSTLEQCLGHNGTA